MSSFNLILYSGAWFVMLFWQIKSKKIFDPACMLSLLFFTYSIFSIILYKDTGFGSIYHNKEITLFPLVYLFIMIYISLYPVFRYDQRKYSTISVVNLNILDLLSIIFIIASFAKIPFDILYIRDNLNNIIFNTTGGNDIYNETMTESRRILSQSGITNLPAIITNIFSELILLITCFNLAVKRRRKLTILLIISLAFIPIFSIASAQRGPAITFITSAVATYLSLKIFYSQKLRRQVTKFFIISICAMSIPFIALTISRFSNYGGGPMSSVSYYVGQENLNFDIYAFDNNGIRNGDRVAPLFKIMVGFENVPTNFWDRRIKYPTLRINDEVFIGYIGDILLDFGPIAGSIIIFLFSLLFITATKNTGTNLPFNKLLLIQFLIVLGASGGMKLFPFADMNGLKIILYFLAFIATTIRIGNFPFKTYTLKHI